MDTPAAQKELEVIHFLVQQVHLCVDLHFIKKIVQLTALRELPGSPPYFAGLLNMEGQSIPVLDLALRLGLKRTENYSLDAPIILCHHNARLAGMIVDNILGLSSIHENALQMEAEFNHQTSPFLGVAALGTQLTLVLHLQKVLAICCTPDKNEFSFDINSVHLAGCKHE